MSTFPSVRDRVNMQINMETYGCRLPEAIFLSSEDYDAFVKEIEPTYKKLYGALVASDKSPFENVLFKGVPVCRRVEAE